jgi:DNA-binding transcriptional LysR family regulator
MHLQVNKGSRILLMTLEQLRIFLAVVENRHFTRAAESFYITQSAVSAAIRNLEAEYKVKLFHRMGRYVDLADAGDLLRVEAQEILDQVALIERGLQRLNTLQEGELNLGVSQTIGYFWLSRLIKQFKQEHPNIKIKCTLDNSYKISIGVDEGLFELGLVEETIHLMKDTCLDRQIVGKDCIVVVVGASHPWFGDEVIPVTALLSTQWILPEEESGIRQRFEEALQNWGIDPSQLNVALETSSSEMTKAAVESGMGATVISELMIVKELQFNALHQIQIVATESMILLPQLYRSSYLVKHRERWQSQASRIFEKMVGTIEPNIQEEMPLLQHCLSQK